MTTTTQTEKETHSTSQLEKETGSPDGDRSKTLSSEEKSTSTNLVGSQKIHNNYPIETAGCGGGLICGERERQVLELGYTEYHDDQHVSEELMFAAMAYMAAGNDPEDKQFAQDYWPADWGEFRPAGSKIANYVKAGACISAEIDRLIRLNSKIE